MYTERFIGADIVMLFLLSFLNYMLLRERFRRLKINSENQSAIKKFKRKWILIFFTDVLFYNAVYFIILLISSNNLSTNIIRSAVLSLGMSLIITSFYMLILQFVLHRFAIYTFGSNYIKDGDIAKAEKVEYKINDKNDINTVSNDKKNKANIEIAETRKLTISRMKQYIEAAVKTYIFIGTDDFNTDDKIITVNNKRFKQAGTISNGKTMNIDISTKSVEILFATLIFKTLQIHTHYSVTSGNDDVILNLKISRYTMYEDSFEVERVK